MKQFIACSLGLVWACWLAIGTARAADLAAVQPRVQCAQLAQVRLDAVGVPVRIGSATAPATGPAGGYCVVSGQTLRAARFEVRLPLSGWTQRYLQTGCGGLCGMLRIDAGKSDGCQPVTDGATVLASTDMGHQGNDPNWGEHLDQREDFAYRANHVTALIAKALIQAFYGQAPRYSYFSGCSDGGREALIEAQRFPQDFDGIAAGAPALNFTVQNSFHHGWLARVNTGPDGRPLLTAVDIAPLHAAVLAACDRLDGLADGQITDPRACHFDPAVIQCKAAYEAGKCLSSQQVAAVRAIYDGARSPTGRRLEVGPLVPGSEQEWIGVFVPRDANGPIGSANMALETINHLLFTPNRTYSIANFPFTDAQYGQEEAARRLYNADDPNLAAFAARGGKLILWHGWADPHISPLNSIDYYERVGRTLGSQRRAAFVRLFLFPGMGHCSGGDGPSEFPLLANLMTWVEGGPAPEVMIAHRASPNGLGLPVALKGRPPAGGPPGGGPPPEMLRDMQRRQAQLAALGPRSRPVYAYPKVAAYGGSGSVDEAANFHAVTPAPTEGISGWIGSGP